MSSRSPSFPSAVPVDRVHAAAAPASAAPRKLKTIGVLGGIGPQATMDFERRVHAAAQHRITGFGNDGFPPLVTYFHRRPPFVLMPDGSPRMPIQLDPDLERAAKRIGAMSDFVVITSNGAHLAADQVERALGRPVLNMVDLTVEHVRRRGWRKVGVITMRSPLVYTERLGGLGIASATLDTALQARLDPMILAYMSGDTSAAVRQPALNALAAVRTLGVDGVILGCTEVPRILGSAAEAPDQINPLQVPADAAVELAMQ